MSMHTRRFQTSDNFNNNNNNKMYEETAYKKRHEKGRVTASFAKFCVNIN